MNTIRMLVDKQVHKTTSKEMKTGDLVNLCKEIAYKTHEGQTRRDGKTPYIKHVEKVVELVGEDEELQCLAWLHDVIEDSKLTKGDLIDEGVPPTMVFLVDLMLTHKEGVSYFDYIKKITGDKQAEIVKIADIVANLSDNPTNRQVTKYYKALYILNDC